MRDLLSFTASFTVLHIWGYGPWICFLPVLAVFVLWPTLPEHKSQITGPRYARIGRPWGVGKRSSLRKAAP